MMKCLLLVWILFSMWLYKLKLLMAFELIKYILNIPMPGNLSLICQLVCWVVIDPDYSALSLPIKVVSLNSSPCFILLHLTTIWKFKKNYLSLLFCSLYLSLSEKIFFLLTYLLCVSTIRILTSGDFLVAQWLKLHASNTGHGFDPRSRN